MSKEGNMPRANVKRRNIAGGECKARENAAGRDRKEASAARLLPVMSLVANSKNAANICQKTLSTISPTQHLGKGFS